jgi:membrane protein
MAGSSAASDASAPEPETTAPTREEPASPSRLGSLRHRLTRSEAKLEAKYDEAKGRRAESEPIDVAFRVIEADRRYAGGLIAGGMAFRVFVVLVPFAFVVVTAFGFVAEAVDSESPQQVARDLGITGLVAGAIDASIGSSSWERVVTLVLALYALLWGTWMLTRAMQAVYGLAWDQPSSTSIGSAWKPVLWLVAILLALFLGGAAISVVLDQVGLFETIVIRVLLFGVIVVLWIAVSWLLPRAPDATWQALVPGAVLVAVATVVLQFLTVAFFSRYIEDKTETYGAIGASLAFLFWAYLLGRIVVTSAFLNAARWRRVHDAPPSGAPADG